MTIDLGYWRKHADLHGYIINTFADGVDECQKIELSEDDLDKIIKAIKNDELEKDHSGFFFGNSKAFGYYDKEEKDLSKETLKGQNQVKTQQVKNQAQKAKGFESSGNDVLGGGMRLGAFDPQ